MEIVFDWAALFLVSLVFIGISIWITNQILKISAARRPLFLIALIASLFLSCFFIIPRQYAMLINWILFFGLIFTLTSIIKLVLKGPSKH